MEVISNVKKIQVNVHKSDHEMVALGSLQTFRRECQRREKFRSQLRRWNYALEGSRGIQEDATTWVSSANFDQGRWHTIRKEKDEAYIYIELVTLHPFSLANYNIYIQVYKSK